VRPYIGVDVVTVLAVTRLLAYVINDRDRWRRFLFLIFLLLAVAAVWWLLADGGVQVVLRDFGSASRSVGAAFGGRRAALPATRDPFG
jgi:hypothetical protein